MWVQTVVPIPANTNTQLVAANALRIGLRWMVTGTNAVTIAPGTTPITAFGLGVIYNPSPIAGQQGSSEKLDPNECLDAFQAYASAATQVVVWELLNPNPTPTVPVVTALPNGNAWG